MSVDKHTKLSDKLQNMTSETNQLTKENHINKKNANADGPLVQDGEFWLSDVIDIEQPQFGSNNLILSPVGSGKFTFINKMLMKNVEGISLILVPNNYLEYNKTSLINKDLAKEINVVKNNSHEINESRILIMTYVQFGHIIVSKNKFIDNVKFIYCYDVHCLVEDTQNRKFKKYMEVILAAHYLFNKQHDKTIYCFTSTNEKLMLLDKKIPTMLDSFATFDYREYSNIKKYINYETETFNQLSQLRKILSSKYYQDNFSNYGYKGLIFSKTINSMKTIEKMLIEEGFTPLVLWSMNNSYYPMNDEQIKAKKELINTGKIPTPYNFLLVSNAMREGLELKDENIQLAIIDTDSKTDQIQARGIIRNNIIKSIIRKGKFKYEMSDEDKRICERFINKKLTNKEKIKLCKELNILNSNEELANWLTIKTMLRASGYKIKDKRLGVSNNTIRVSIISK